VRVAMLRSAVVLATHGGALPRLMLPMRLGVGGRLGNGRQWFPWITLDDEVRAIEFALTHEAMRGPFNSAAPGVVTNSEFIKALARAMHRPALFPAPAFGLRLLLGEMADELLLFSQRVVPRKLLEAGFAFEHADVESALAAVLGTPPRAAPALKTY